MRAHRVKTHMLTVQRFPVIKTSRRVFLTLPSKNKALEIFLFYRHKMTNSRPGRFFPRDYGGTYSTAGWVGSITRLEVLQKRKTSCTSKRFFNASLWGESYVKYQLYIYCNCFNYSNQIIVL
jgi:hypothetical protein